MQQKYLDIKNKFLSLEADLQNPVIINDVEKLKNASPQENRHGPSLTRKSIIFLMPMTI